MSNRNRRDQHRATFGPPWRWRITPNTLDTITRWSQGLTAIMDRIAEKITAFLGRIANYTQQDFVLVPPQAPESLPTPPQLHTSTTTPPEAPKPPSSRTAPTGGFTEAPGWRAQPGFSVDTPPPDHPALLLSLSLDREPNAFGETFEVVRPAHQDES